jgi:hypothetical protein
MDHLWNDKDMENLNQRYEIGKCIIFRDPNDTRKIYAV